MTVGGKCTELNADFSMFLLVNFLKANNSFVK